MEQTRDLGSSGSGASRGDNGDNEQMSDSKEPQPNNLQHSICSNTTGLGQGSPVQGSPWYGPAPTATDKSKESSLPSGDSSASSSPTSDDSQHRLSDEANQYKQDQGEGVKLPKKKKLDRSKLRKGKWTVEEEEYTSRIIHYFNIGLLTLPENATLRSYLADKLNCDPMRITKKYAGASCLGRKVFQVRDKPQLSMVEIQLSKAELDMLERRFRQRVEEGKPGVPLPPHPVIAMTTLPHVSHVPAMPALSLSSVLPAGGVSNAPVAAPLGNGFGGLTIQGLRDLAQCLASQPPTVAVPVPPAPASAPAPFLNLGGAMSGVGSLSGSHALDLLLTQMLLSQAAASSVGQAFPQQQQQPAAALSCQLHSGSTAQQRHVPSQSAYHNQRLSPQAHPSSGGSAHTHFIEELEKTYKQHLASQSTGNGMSASNLHKSNPTPASTTNASNSSFTKALHKPPMPVSHKRAIVPASNKEPTSKRQNHESESVSEASFRANEDSNIMMGFLKSLRSSFESAVAQEQARRVRQQQEDSEESNSSDERPTTSGERRRPATVTDSSSQQQESCSSVDESDWNSEDKKTDASSSNEDSDKDDAQEKYKEAVNYSKGPPRKRLKSKRTESSM